MTQCAPRHDRSKRLQFWLTLLFIKSAAVRKTIYTVAIVLASLFWLLTTSYGILLNSFAKNFVEIITHRKISIIL